jgi:hypothetical protein
MQKYSDFVGNILYKLNYIKFITNMLFLNKKSFKVYFFEYIIRVAKIYLDIVDIVIKDPIRKCLEYIFSYKLALYVSDFFVIPFYLIAIPFSLAKIFVDEEKSNDFFKRQEGVENILAKAKERQSYIQKKYFLKTFGRDRNE